jgi:hypothetical protein
VPFANYHSARLRPPGEFKKGTFRTISQTTGDGRRMQVVIGVPKRSRTGGTRAQALRYPTDEWTVGQARASARRNDAILFEPAKRSSPMPKRKRRRNPGEKTKKAAKYAGFGWKGVMAIGGAIVLWMNYQNKKREREQQARRDAIIAQQEAEAKKTGGQRLAEGLVQKGTEILDL